MSCNIPPHPFCFVLQLYRNSAVSFDMPVACLSLGEIHKIWSYRSRSHCIPWGAELEMQREKNINGFFLVISELLKALSHSSGCCLFVIPVIYVWWGASFFFLFMWITEQPTDISGPLSSPQCRKKKKKACRWSGHLQAICQCHSIKSRFDIWIWTCLSLKKKKKNQLTASVWLGKY